MARISHPTNATEIEVEIVDEASHNGRLVQVQAVEDGVTLSDQSGDAPWVEADEVGGVDA